MTFTLTEMLKQSQKIPATITTRTLLNSEHDTPVERPVFHFRKV